LTLITTKNAAGNNNNNNNKNKAKAKAKNKGGILANPTPIPNAMVMLVAIVVHSQTLKDSISLIYYHIIISLFEDSDIFISFFNG
jgi:hypothetical protein